MPTSTSKKFELSRRTLLRGMVAGSAVGIGLPALDVMLNSQGTAFAAGEAFPKRFGVWFQGCGVTGKDKQTALDAFFPKATGPAWEPSRLMMPLVPYRDYMTIVGGTQWGIAESTPHHTTSTGRFTTPLTRAARATPTI